MRQTANLCLRCGCTEDAENAEDQQRYGTDLHAGEEGKSGVRRNKPRGSTSRPGKGLLVMRKAKAELHVYQHGILGTYSSCASTSMSRHTVSGPRSLRMIFGCGQSVTI